MLMFTFKKIIVALALFGISLGFFSFFGYLHAYGGEKNTYTFGWLDPDKEVYVLQNRKYRKDGKLYINVGGGITTSGAFVGANNYQFRTGYFFMEDWGFEFLYSMNSGKENDVADSVRNNGGSGSVPFRRITNNYMGGSFVWSPFYGKVNTFNTIVYFDWFLGLGYVKLTETNNKQELLVSDKTEQTETHNGVMWNTALRFYINETWNTRLDLTGIHYRGQKVRQNNTNNGDAWYTNYDLTLSLGFVF